MIHTTLPFFNPLLTMTSGIPFPWPIHGHSSPPNSPPSSPVSNTTVWQRPHTNGRPNNFSIDAILGHHQQHHAEGPINQIRQRRDERICRTAPYQTSPEQTSPSSQGSNNNSGSGKSKVKRVRTIFTAEQLERLEAEFSRTQYMVGPGRLYLAATLNLTEAQVKVWFQNRRIKWRKQYMEQQHAKLANSKDNEEDPSGSAAEEEDRTPTQSPASSEGLEVLEHNDEGESDEGSAEDSPQTPQSTKLEQDYSQFLTARITAAYQQQLLQESQQHQQQIEPENLVKVEKSEQENNFL